MVLVLLCSTHVSDSQVIDAVDCSLNIISLVHDLSTDAFLNSVISELERPSKICLARRQCTLEFVLAPQVQSLVDRSIEAPVEIANHCICRARFFLDLLPGVVFAAAKKHFFEIFNLHDLLINVLWNLIDQIGDLLTDLHFSKSHQLIFLYFDHGFYLFHTALESNLYLISFITE